MDLYHSRLTQDDLNELIIKYKIPCDLHPRLPSEDFVMSELSDDVIGVYHCIFEFYGVRIPFSSFLLALIKHYKVHFTQLGPLGLNKTLCKQGDWVSFVKRRAPSLVCIDDNRSCMKHRKSGFFLIDRRAIPDYMTWRHPDSAIDDPKSITGSYRMADVRRLIAHVVKLRDMPEGVLVMSGLSRVWKSRTYDPVLRGADGNVIEVDTQLKQEIFQRENLFQIKVFQVLINCLNLNDLKAQVPRERHWVTKLIAENEHLKQTYKQLYDSIKPARIRSKEQCDDLINQVNIKSAEISDLNASLQEKALAITTLKDELRKLKGKALVDNNVSNHPSDPELHQVNVEPQYAL
ncbi:hypothetical protein Tco_0205944 [Tanacetum coccineum]